MAAAHGILRSRTLRPHISLHHPRTLSTAPTNHEFLPRNPYLNSWTPPKNPKEAEARLAQLRREYAKKVKLVRKDYIEEMELLRLEKQRKDEAKREATRIANEERKAAKAATKKAQAAERELAEQEFRQTLLKERAERLEYWKMKVKQVEEKREQKNREVRERSSLWIGEADLEKKVFEAAFDSTNTL